MNPDQGLQRRDLALEVAIIRKVIQETGQGHLQTAIFQEDHIQLVALVRLERAVLLQRRELWMRKPV